MGESLVPPEPHLVASRSLEVFNRALALERLDGDDERLKDLLGAFQKNVPSVVQDLEKALARKKSDRFESLATELRESARRIGAEGTENLAERMIEAARGEKYGELESAMTHLSMELDWLLRILDENRCSGNL